MHRIPRLLGRARDLAGGLLPAIMSVLLATSATLVPSTQATPAPVSNAPRRPASTARPTAELPLTELLARTRPSVVIVKAQSGLRRTALGSGFVVDSSGLVATNAHVVRGAATIIVMQDDGTAGQVATPLYYDEQRDIALLYVDNCPGPALRLRTNRQLRPGERIAAIGHPEGLEYSASDGIVSALRTVDGGRVLIQITAPISPGSSGGPILSFTGEVVGMAMAQLREGQNLNFAIPASQLADAIASARLRFEATGGSPEEVAAIGREIRSLSAPTGFDLFEAKFMGERLFAMTRTDVEALLGAPTAVGGLTTVSGRDGIRYFGAFMFYGPMGLMFQFNHPAQDARQLCTGVYIHLVPEYNQEPMVYMQAYTGPMSPAVDNTWTRGRVLAEWHERGPVDQFNADEVIEAVQTMREAEASGIKVGSSARAMVETYFAIVTYTEWGNIVTTYDVTAPHGIKEVKILKTSRR